MKKLSMSIFVLVFSVHFLFSQTTPKLQFQGGAWIGTNQKTTFVGLIGPKISMTKSFQKTKVEVGFTGIPGLFLHPEQKFGLVMGPTFTLSKDQKKRKVNFWSDVFQVGNRLAIFARSWLDFLVFKIKRCLTLK